MFTHGGAHRLLQQWSHTRVVVDLITTEWPLMYFIVFGQNYLNFGRQRAPRQQLICPGLSSTALPNGTHSLKHNPPHSCTPTLLAKAYLLFTGVVITTLWQGSDKQGQRNRTRAPEVRGSVFASDPAAKLRDDLRGIIHNNDKKLILNNFISYRNSILS